MKLNNTTRKNEGFALVEVLVALAVIALLIAAFTPLFSQTLKSLLWAGKQTADINTARGQIEERIGSQTGYRSGAVSVTFPGVGSAITIDGGVIDGIQNFTAFIPFAPAITLSPTEIKEGYPSNTTITINGKNTNFTSSTTAKAIWADNTETNLTTQYVNSTQVMVTMPVAPGLLNCNGPYVIVVTTGTEVVRATLNVRLPMAVAGGTAGSVIFTGDGNYWESRTSGTSYKITGIDAYSKGFFAVGEGGTLLKLEDGKPWSAMSSGTTQNLNNVSTMGSTILLVGDRGTVIQSSTDQTSFAPITGLPTAINDVNLKGIATNNSVLVLTGNDYRTTDTSKKNDGAIITVDSSGTSNFILRDEQPINDVVWNNNKFVAVGNGGTVVTSSDGTTWPSVFNPGDSTISGLKVWLKADAITAADINASNTVTTWRDSSGSGNNAILASGTTPTFVTSVINGLPVVRFDSNGNDQLNLPSLGISNSFTVFCVAQPTGTSSAKRFILAPDAAATSSAANMGLSLNTTGIGIYERIRNSGGSSRYSSSRPSITLTSSPFGLVDAVYNAGNSALYYDGNPPTTATRTGNTIYFPTKIGHCDDGSFLGDIAEILVYNRTLSDDERIKVESYLASKYKLYSNFTAVCASPTTTVAVGTNGAISSAANTSNTWTKQSSGTGLDLYDVNWIGDRFVAVGPGGLILSSTNGTSWSPVTSGTSADLYAIGS